MSTQMTVNKPTTMINGDYIACVLRNLRREWLDQKNADPAHAKDAALALAVFDEFIDLLPDNLQAIARETEREYSHGQYTQVLRCSKDLS